MIKEEKFSVQEWLPFQKILSNGIIKVDNYTYVKILKVDPINYNLKSEFEKKVIINSYKTFLKTYNFNFQILIQSDKENIFNHISKINSKKLEKNNKLLKIKENYINYIKEINNNKKSSNKNYYLIINNSIIKNEYKDEKSIINELNDNFFKIKECLSRCENNVKEISNKNEIKNILYSFFNRRLYNCCYVKQNNKI